MKLLTALALTVLTGAQTQPSGVTKVSAALNFTMNSIDGRPIDLSKYHGRVVLMVNVASQCGYTPQYAGLEELYKKYAANGLSILGFPSNDFGAQEPGSDAEIAQFCKQNYGVEFDMFSKIVVRGPGQAPLYKYLTTHPKFSGQVDWNFEKFLVAPGGRVVNRFRPRTEPEDPEVIAAIELTSRRS